MWLLIDNNDSFSFILLDYIQRFHPDTMVIHIDDGYRLEDLIQLRPERIIISPGPGHPLDAQLSGKAVAHFYKDIPILGICLGHQILGIQLGAQCHPSGTPLHGKTSSLKLLRDHFIFDGIDQDKMEVMHYHSLVLSRYETTDIIALAEDQHGFLMALTHRRYPLLGLQFHPESILTKDGLRMIQNWCKYPFKAG